MLTTRDGYISIKPIGLAAAAGLALLITTAAARAQQPPDPVFPAISMTENQVVQLIVFLALPPQPDTPCDLTMSFIDEFGVTFPDAVPTGVSKRVVYGDGGLGPDDVSTLVLLGEEAFQTVARGTDRVLFRARLSDPDQDCPPVAAVVELFNKVGKPAILVVPPSPVLSPNPTVPPDPVQPPDPHFPAFSLNKSLTAQLNVYLAVPPSPIVPCNLTMSFVDEFGVVIPDGTPNGVSATVVYGDGVGELGADEVSSLLLSGELVLETVIDRGTSVLVRATLTAPAEDECPPVAAAVELFSSMKDNQTKLVVPPNPVLPPNPVTPPDPI